jgi:hypothetical protein
MNPLSRYNEKGELDTRLRVDPITGDVGIGTPQRTWVGLTEDQIDELEKEFIGFPVPNIYNFVQAIEAKLKERNT